MEVIVAGSVGFVYVLDAASGAPLDGWPIQMGEVQGQVLAADVNGDGVLEVVAGGALALGGAAGARSRGGWARCKARCWRPRQVGGRRGAGVRGRMGSKSLIGRRPKGHGECSEAGVVAAVRVHTTTLSLLA